MYINKSINDVNNKKIKGSSIKHVKFLDEETIQITFVNNHHILLQSKSTGYGGETGIFIVKDTLKELNYKYNYE